MIPKIIHYCWLSNDPIPEELQGCMASWKKYLPDYEFMKWDFNRFDKESCPWVSEAFDAKKYAFAADYIRIYALYKYGGIYYLMTMLQYSEPVNVLELYVSDKLKGPYTVHPCSPITRSNKVGRDAGCWIEHQGKLLRVSQDCTHRYGDNVHVSEITKLSPTEYEETILKEKILPTDIPFYKEGGHQFNVINFKGKWIVATDAKEYHRLLITRIIHKIKSRL